MRTAAIVVTTALISALVAIWGTTAIVATPHKSAPVTAASASIDVMQMMNDARNLPVEQFDTH